MGGNEEGKEFVSGHGNFGDMLCFENVERSIAYSGFMSPGHMINANKKANYSLSEKMAKYTVDHSWRRIMGMMIVAIGSKFKGRDF